MTTQALVVPAGEVKFAVAWVQPLVEAVYVLMMFVLMTVLLALSHCICSLKVNESLEEGMFTRAENA